jgi:hypothetical protein
LQLPDAQFRDGAQIQLALLTAIVRRTAHFCGMRLQRWGADRN